jgi:Flp pilus assembly protein protease CpaA
VSALATALLSAAGAAAGLGAGALGVQLERVERLEQEELEERHAFETEEAERTAAAAGTAATASAPLPWRPERYGWTWLEWLAAPALCAFGFAAFAAHEGITATLGIHLFYVVLFTHVTIFDIKHRLILNRVSYPAIVLAIALAPLSPGVTLRNAVVGAAAVFIFFMLQSTLLGDTVVGLGDAKLGAIVGASTGLGFDLDHLGALYAVIAAVISAGVVALVLLITRVRGLKDPIPYGPFLCAGAALIVYHGPAGP